MSAKSSRSDSIQFLASLRRQGVLVRAERRTLVCNAPKGALTPELREQLALRKPELLEPAWRSPPSNGRRSRSPPSSARSPC